MPTTTVAVPRGQTIDVLMKDQGVDFATLATGNYTKTYIFSHDIKETADPVDDQVLGVGRTNDRDSTDPQDGLPQLAGPLVVPLDFNHFGLHLKGLFGAATVAGAGDPYTHTFKSGGETLPYRSMEIALKNVDAVTKYQQLVGLVHGKMTLEFSRQAGTQKATFDMTGRHEVTPLPTSSGGGSPATAWARDEAVATLAKVQIDSGGGYADVADITRLTLNYDNAPAAQEHLTGSPYIAGYDLLDNSRVTGSFDLRFRSTVLRDYAAAKTVLPMQIVLSKSGSRSLTLTMPRTRLFRPGIAISGPGGIQQAFNFRADQDANACTLTAVLKSLVPTY